MFTDCEDISLSSVKPARVTLAISMQLMEVLYGKESNNFNVDKKAVMILNIPDQL